MQLVPVQSGKPVTMVTPTIYCVSYTLDMYVDMCLERGRERDTVKGLSLCSSAKSEDDGGQQAAASQKSFWELDDTA